MTRWPAWYPGKSLAAKDLINLEDYVLSRSSVCDAGHGIVDFDFFSISAERLTEDSFSVMLSELKGITPSGQPVIVGSAGPTV